MNNDELSGSGIFDPSMLGEEAAKMYHYFPGLMDEANQLRAKYDMLTDLVLGVQKALLKYDGTNQSDILLALDAIRSMVQRIKIAESAEPDIPEAMRLSQETVKKYKVSEEVIEQVIKPALAKLTHFAEGRPQMFVDGEEILPDKISNWAEEMEEARKAVNTLLDIVRSEYLSNIWLHKPGRRGKIEGEDEGATDQIFWLAGPKGYQVELKANGSVKIVHEDSDPQFGELWRMFNDDVQLTPVRLESEDRAGKMFTLSEYPDKIIAATTLPQDARIYSWTKEK